MTIIRTNINSPADKIIRVPNNEPVSNSTTGWAQYADTTYTELSPFIVESGTTVILQNHANTTITSQLNGLNPLYDPLTFKITPDTIGDAYVISIRFKAKTSVTGDYLSIGLDIGGTQGVIIEESRVFNRGAGNEQFFSFTLPIYSLNTFKANGGLIKVTANTGDLSIYGVVYVIIRTHEGIL